MTESLPSATVGREGRGRTDEWRRASTLRRRGAFRELAEIGICTAPAMALVATGRFREASWWFFSTWAASLVRSLIAGDEKRFALMVVACIPAWMLLRNVMNYLWVLVAPVVAILFWHLRAPRDVRRAAKKGALGVLIVGGVAYWLLSWANTGSLSQNVRILETGSIAALVVLLARRKVQLVSAMRGFGLVTLFVAVAAWGSGERLGIIENEDSAIGNPGALGLAATIMLLLSTADGGEHLGLKPRSGLRYVLIAGYGGVVALSTSRQSWITALVGMGLVVVLARRQRLASALSIAVTAATLWLVLSVPQGEVVGRYFLKATDTNRTWNQRTTQRADQWESAPRVVLDAPMFGHGAGRGLEVHYRYTGRALTWHALYLQVAVETGILGLCAVAAAMLQMVASANRWRRRTGAIMPLVAAVGFMANSVSITSTDAVSGVFLGLAFANLLPRPWVKRSNVAAPVDLRLAGEPPFAASSNALTWRRAPRGIGGDGSWKTFERRRNRPERRG